MNNHMKIPKLNLPHSIIKSWRTSAFGFAAIVFGIWLLKVHYVPYQTFKFNLLYTMPPGILFIIVGCGLLHARDHKHKD